MVATKPPLLSSGGCRLHNVGFTIRVLHRSKSKALKAFVFVDLMVDAILGDVAACQQGLPLFTNIGALIITYYVLGAPYYSYNQL